MELLSCDNAKDAIRSLALVYQVNECKVAEIANGAWPTWITTSEERINVLFDSKYMPWLMGDLVNSRPRLEFSNIAYYHRTSYNGTKEWFEGGVLDSISGTRAYLENARALIPDFERVMAIALANVTDRTGFEGVGGGGPYAFGVFEDAERANITGLNYGAPEFLCGRHWRGRNEFECATDLYEKFLANFEPVVVKFSASTENIETYITNLWQYLYRAWKNEPITDCDHYPCTFEGRGITIPPEKIIEIIKL